MNILRNKFYFAKRLECESPLSLLRKCFLHAIQAIMYIHKKRKRTFAFQTLRAIKLKINSSSFLCILYFFAILFLIFSPHELLSIDFTPWLGRNYEVETQGIYRFQSYHEIDTPNGTIYRNAHDHFFILNASLTGLGYEGCKERLNVQLEGMIADTHLQRPNIDYISATVRYRWFNDIVGDSLSVTPGFTIINAFRHSLIDPSSFHHGQIEMEFHTAIGKEFSCEDFWTSRIWGLTAVGFGDHGQPWVRGDINWERNWWNQQRVRFYVHTLWGMGRHNLHLHKHFTGYGRIRHQSVDVGIKHSFFFENGSSFSTEYAHRAYARNFPSHANFFLLSFLYPIGL